MEDSAMLNGATTQLTTTSHIPIAKLTPDLESASARSVKAIVTLTWPYSSATGFVAFLLAEPDFRLRRKNGQVRVQFSGSSAKNIAKSGISSGDEVILSLDGVEWVHEASTTGTPGKSVELELKFTERLRLEFRQEDSDKINLIDIDHPELEPEPAPEMRIPTPESSTSTPTPSSDATHATPDSTTRPADEWLSPAFIKRARTSYGSLFDSDYDPFTEEDGTVQGRGRKRTRLSSTWRYSSRSTSPEVERSEEPEVSSAVIHEKPAMTDEGCQTSGLDDLVPTGVTEILVNSSRQAINVARSSYEETVNGVISTHDEVQAGLGLGDGQLEIQQTTMLAPISLSNFEPTIIDTLKAKNGSSQQPLFSPRLQPLSDAPPLVPPLVTSKYGSGGGHVVQDGAFDSENLNQPPISVEEQEDIYGASPLSCNGQSRDSAFQGGQDFEMESSEARSLHESERITGDQYGDWQDSVAAVEQMSNAVSPHEGTQYINEVERSYGQGVREEASDNSEHPSDRDLVRSSSHSRPYPDPEEIHDPHSNLAGLQHPSTAANFYPDSEEVESRNSAHRSPYAGSAVMSRSQSVESKVVNLTEDSSEDEDEDVEEEESFDEFEDEDYENVNLENTGNWRRQFDHKNEYEEGDPDEEEFYEEDYPENHSGLHAHQSQGLEDGEHDLSQSSYDDEDEDDNYDEEVDDKAILQREPEVIDLLSSDDEDDTENKMQPPISRDYESVQHTHESKDVNEGPNNEEHVDEEFSEEHPGDEERTEIDEDIEDVLQVSYPELPELSGTMSQLPSRESSIEYVEDPDDNDEMTCPEGIPELKEDSKSSLAVDFGQEPTSYPIPLYSDAQSVQEHVTNFKETHNKDQRIQTKTQKVSELVHNIDGQGGKDSTLKAPDEISSNIVHIPEGSESEIEEPANGIPIIDSLISLATGSPNKSSFQKVFNFDGANDEYHISDIPFNSIHHSKLLDMEPIRQTQAQRASVQLPTPENTQVSHTIITAESSFTSTQDLSDATQEDIVNLASGPSAIDSLENASETVVKTDDTIVVENDDLDTNKISQDTAKISFEETQSEKIQSELDAQITMEQDQIPIDSVESTMASPPQTQQEVKSSESIAEADIVRPSTPVQSSEAVEPGSAQTDISRSILLDDNTSSDGHDASVELATTAIESPSKGHTLRKQPSVEETPTKQHNLRNLPIVDLKLRLSRTLRTELGEFTPLKMMRYHLTHKLDVLAIATTTPPEPQRMKGGPRHYVITFSITDVSIAPSGVAEVQVFRPYKDALPIVKAGNGILLRNFQVTSLKGKGFGLRSDQNEASSWAVFKEGEDEAEIRGPPVEYGITEKRYINDLKNWYKDLDSTAMAKLSRANGDKPSVKKGISKVS
ncbi:hypothetical protein B7494_g5247 [Chlorociboria aeruginascens]|nr:hypothetical protein B7494_g5247 [Chlorociboria aeruginascens]